MDGHEHPVEAATNAADNPVNAEGAADRVQRQLQRLDGIVTLFALGYRGVFAMMREIAAAQPEADARKLQAGLQTLEEARQGAQSELDGLIAQVRLDATFTAFEVANLRRLVTEQERIIDRLTGGSLKL
ncbi:MAG: hypothetical protein IT450_16835 [Phycisphaerales bacterium]|nr:hypothetical protein [Phycisphaerales bacterium]